MAVRAGPGEQEPRGASTRKTLRGLRHARMPELGMTLLAQQGRPLGQQRRVYGPVRRMAQVAILGHRCVLPQKRTSLVSVAGVAGLIERRALQQCGRACPVGLVTVAAIQLTKPHRMIRGFEKLGTLLQVALETYLRLSHPVEHGIMRRMDGVAVGTGYLGGLVWTSLPPDVVVILMAFETHAVLRLHRLVRFVAEIQDGRTLFTRLHLADVGACLLGCLHERHALDARPMTGFALQSGERRALISPHRMFGLEDVEDRILRILVVTLDTGVGASLRILDGADGGSGQRSIVPATRGLDRLSSLPGKTDRHGENAPQQQQ